jgi:endonuclease YncB( thermonuclease family)
MLVDRKASLRLCAALAVICLFLSLPTAFSHPGGLDKNGCHVDRKTGIRHCHEDRSETKELLTCELSPPPKAGDLGVFYGSFVRVIDGDTFEAKVQGVVMHFRLAEVDAPESDQPYGDKSTSELRSLLAKKELVLVPSDTDRYGRTVAFTWVGDTCVNSEVIRRGAAWFYDEYSHGDALFHVEDQARVSRVGLWALPPDQRVPPQQWRAEKR